MKIGVFDSGIGGLSVAKAIERSFPDDEVIFVNDKENIPYGTKTPDTLYTLVHPILDNLVKQGCGVIVIACNTVSTTIIERLRATSTIPLVALEPMVKPAAQLSTTKVITVCATPATLSSDRYAWLKRTYAGSCTVLEPDCADWASLIEQSALNETKIRANIEPALAAKSDVIVLGCTHYHWIEKEIEKIAGQNVTILQPEQAVISQLQRVMKEIAHPSK